MKYLCVQLDKLVRLRKTLDFGQILFVAFYGPRRSRQQSTSPGGSQFNYVPIISYNKQRIKRITLNEKLMECFSLLLIVRYSVSGSFNTPGYVMTVPDKYFTHFTASLNADSSETGS